MRARQMRDQAHGGYEESTSEKEVMDFTTYITSSPLLPVKHLTHHPPALQNTQ